LAPYRTIIHGEDDGGYRPSQLGPEGGYSADDFRLNPRG
jgi:hypothetical protein